MFWSRRDRRDLKRLMEREDKMFCRREKAGDTGFELDPVPDVKRGGKVSSYKIFSLKSLLPTSLQYAERRREGCKREKEVEKEGEGR